jgi:hypothetical protein
LLHVELLLIGWLGRNIVPPLDNAQYAGSVDTPQGYMQSFCILCKFCDFDTTPLEFCREEKETTTAAHRCLARARSHG